MESSDEPMNPQFPGHDGELLAAFAQNGDQAAFAELVQRHGAMVHGIAARVLGDHHEAQDVAQAVFLTLARKARSLRKDPSLTGWLHRVTICTARDARMSRQRRHQREDQTMQETSAVEPSAIDQRVFREELDAAIDQLPDRYRRPLTEFHLQGRSLQETARLLGLNVSATGVRLSRARELLRKKLVRRGVTVGSVGALTALLSAESGAAVLPATIVASTVSAATGGTVSTTVAALTKGALNMLFWNSVKTAAVTALCVGAVGTSVVVAQRAVSDSSPAPAAKTKVLDVNNTMGTLVEVAADGTVVLDLNTGGNPGGGQTARITIPAADGYADAVRTSAARYKAGELVQAFWYRDAGKRRALAVAGPTDPTPAALSALEMTGFAAAPRAVTGDPGKVFKAIDTTQSGTYGDGKWSYALEIKGDQQQGFLKYDAKNVGDPQPGDYILTPWGWMQWQNGTWLPVAEKPAKGNQLPDPAK